MRKIRDVLRLHVQGRLTNRQIARSLGLSRSTVAEYLGRAETAGLGWPLPEGLDETSLEQRLFPPFILFDSQPRPQPEWALRAPV
jgi:DNA-binding transcriptional regulator LsrR (DeoR family)